MNQCLGITKKKTQCKRIVRNGQFCFIHEHQPEVHQYQPDASTVNVVCKSCLDEFNANDVIVCRKDASHIICNECLKRCVIVWIESAKIDMKCIYDGSEHCHGHYDESQFKNILDDDEYARLIDIRQMSVVAEMASIIPNYQICGKCRMWGIQVDVKTKMEIKCSGCDFSWCNLCQSEFHDRTCYYIDGSKYKTKTEKRIKIANILSEIKTNSVMHCCPHCNVKFVKDEGCNLIKCNKCNGHSCYICGIKIHIKQNSYYHHFKNHPLNTTRSTCELFTIINETTTNIINTKILNNYEELIDDNEERTQPLIIKMMLKMHSDDSIVKNGIKSLRVKKFGKCWPLKIPMWFWC